MSKKLRQGQEHKGKKKMTMVYGIITGWSNVQCKRQSNPNHTATRYEKSVYPAYDKHT